MICGFRQTRLGQLATKKHGTASAGLMREYGMRLEKTRKSLLAVARLQAGRSSRASLQAGRTIRPSGRTMTRSGPPVVVDADAASSQRRRSVAKRRYTHAPIVGAVNLSELAGRVDPREPSALRHDPQLRIVPSMPIILQMCAPKHATFV